MEVVVAVSNGEDFGKESLKQKAELETNEIEKIPSEFVTKHPLQNRWTLWYDNPERKLTSESWVQNLKKIITFDTVEDFWRIYNNIRPASKIQLGSNYHIFKEGIMPMWEHEENKRGGKWVVTKTKKEGIDNAWLWTILACIGENFAEEDEICGAVVSVRKSQDRVALWTKHANNEPGTRSVGQVWKRVLELPQSSNIGYQAHEESMKANTSNVKYLYEI